MSDIVFLFLIGGSFAALVLFVGWCDRIVGGDTPPTSLPVTDDGGRP